MVEIVLLIVWVLVLTLVVNLPRLISYATNVTKKPIQFHPQINRYNLAPPHIHAHVNDCDFLYEFQEMTQEQAATEIDKLHTVSRN